MAVEEAAAVLVFGNPLACERAVLNVVQHRLHVRLGLLVGEDARAGDVLAVFRGVGNGVVHRRHAALVDKVNNQLHFVDALEVGVFGLVAGFHQRLEAAAHQLDDAAAQDSLLAEQVGFGLVVHGRLHDACARAADARDVRQRGVKAVTGRILLDRDEARHTLAHHIGAADGVAGALRRCHEHVHASRGHNLLVADVEAVREGNRLAFGQVGGNVLLVHVRLTLIVDENHDDIRLLRGFRNGHHVEAVLDCHGPAFAALAQTHDDIHAGIAQVQRVGMTLRAVADDGDGLAGQLIQVTILFIVHFCHSRILLLLWSVRQW